MSMIYAPYAIVAAASGVVSRSSSVMPNVAQKALWFPISCNTFEMVFVQLSICPNVVLLAASRLRGIRLAQTQVRAATHAYARA